MTNCRHFNGYKPCGKSEICDSLCPSLAIPGARILLIHLEALGAVMRSTALLPAIRRKFANAHITWVTSPAAAALLQNNSLIDRVLTTSVNDLLALSALQFDAALCVDKSLAAGGVLKQTQADFIYGFRVDGQSGAIVPATSAADELWNLGLSNQQKFFVNQKAETQLIAEALELGPYIRDEYVLRLSESERREALARRQQWAPQPEHIVIGLNTGCAATIPYKKLSIERHRDLITRLSEDPRYRVVLLGGGAEDALRNERIGHGLAVVQTPTSRGLRDGMISMEACDLIVSGDSLGLHMAIALRKWVVAWFGPTCAQEIDLFDRGVKVQTQASCSPCWKRSCQQTSMCYDQVSVDALLEGLNLGAETLRRHSDHSDGVHRGRTPLDSSY